MKKEVAIAIVIGLILGLIVTFGIYMARQPGSSVKRSAEMLASARPESPDASPVQNSLVISSPEDGLITSDKVIQVSGTTTANAFVFIFSGDSYVLEKADNTGNFSTKIPTQPGLMFIVVRTLDETGATVEDERALYIGDPDNLATAISNPTTSTVSASPRPTRSPRPTASPRATSSPRVTATPTPRP